MRVPRKKKKAIKKLATSYYTFDKLIMTFIGGGTDTYYLMEKKYHKDLVSQYKADLKRIME